ncbi:HesB/YadR/YfhF family protein [Sporosarcina aquimarina]|uniref:HesB/YadR/YfhF family protein n=1 Tax=Sporosarcina aquimarina TaxID=114975 RepID=A0ABU4FXM5_9BACL|nr:HesB/YadR/YfhF family protein [Sporosarcina aquimarina]MDW0109475.1 HesB/YadR/YfhF family protein [Sporosarcina aquimarina]
MNIYISNDAARWFAEEMDAESGDAIRFFARYGGSSPLHEGFSLGIMKELPDEVAVEFIEDGVRYYIETRDLWYFDGHDLHVGVNDELGELHYEYVKPE